MLQVITPSHMSGAEMQLVRLYQANACPRHELPVLVKHDSPAIEHMLEKGLSVDRARIGGKVNFMAISRIACARRITSRCRPRAVDAVDGELVDRLLERLAGRSRLATSRDSRRACWHSRQSHLLAVSLCGRSRGSAGFLATKLLC